MKETPLFFAVKNGHKECVELLLRSGANSEVLNIRLSYFVEPGLCLSLHLFARVNGDFFYFVQ